jgi:hypothetical protein
VEFASTHLRSGERGDDKVTTHPGSIIRKFAYHSS